MKKYKLESDKKEVDHEKEKAVGFSCNCTPTWMSENSRSLEIGFKLGHLLVAAKYPCFFEICIMELDVHILYSNIL